MILPLYILIDKITFIVLYIIQSTMQATQQCVDIKLYDFLRIQPTTIKSLYANTTAKTTLTEPALTVGRLTVAREGYSQVYQVDLRAEPVIQQIAELQPCQHLLFIGDTLLMFKQFQLRMFRNSRWQAHSFTTQLLSIRVVEDRVYSFHERESMLWDLTDDDFSYKYLSETLTPYHIDSQGCLAGFGKKVAVGNKSKLTVCEVVGEKWVLVGDQGGSLHVYDYKFCSHISTFTQHAAAIMAIKVDHNTNTAFFSGTDSKVAMIRLTGQQWRLGTSIRAQSHDILGLQLMGEYLLSGGVTTDICFYKLQSGQLGDIYYNKVSYCSTNRISNQLRLVVVNLRRSFEVWQMGDNLNRTQLLVNYQMPAQKFIVDTKLFRQPIQDKTYLLLVFTDEDTVGWKFNTQTGLTKYITIQNQYTLAQIGSNYSFIGVRSDGMVERVSCTNGRIEEMGHCEVELPTDIKLMGKNMLLVASKLTLTAHIFSLKKKEVVKRVPLRNTYGYLDVLGEELIVQYFNQNTLNKILLFGKGEQELVRLPVSIIRFGGWLSNVSRQGSVVKSKKNKYWFGVSEGKVVLIANLEKISNKDSVSSKKGSDGKRKVRVKQSDRIGQIIRPTGKALGCNLGIIPYDFDRMIKELPVKPVFTKKIV